jgi:starch phosphorylase
VLAGDVAKEASDLGIPLIGVGFMYPQGYFHQAVSPEGWQQEVYERLNWANAPSTGRRRRPSCVIAVLLGNRTVLVSVWRSCRSRESLPPRRTSMNAPGIANSARPMAAIGNRIQQEIILGIGGSGPQSHGDQPAAWHQRGHAAFVVPQRIRDRIEGGALRIGLDAVRRTTIFTTHTPVPAGHDAFPFTLVETHLAARGGRSAPTATPFSRSGTTTTAAARSST